VFCGDLDQFNLFLHHLVFCLDGRDQIRYTPGGYLYRFEPIRAAPRIDLDFIHESLQFAHFFADQVGPFYNPEGAGIPDDRCGIANFKKFLIQLTKPVSQAYEIIITNDPLHTQKFVIHETQNAW